MASPNSVESEESFTLNEEKLPDRQKFDEKIQEIIRGKKRQDNLNYITDDQYAQFLKDVKAAKTKTTAKTSVDKRRLKRFAVCTIQGTDKLIAPVESEDATMQFFVTVEELYDVIRTAHLQSGHKGKNVMHPQLSKKYANVPREAVQIFADMCPTCATKKRGRKRGLTVKPMVFKQMNDRWQVDLVDWQSSADQG